MGKAVPVKAVEPGVRLDVRCAALKHAQALRWVVHEQPPNQVPQLLPQQTLTCGKAPQEHQCMRSCLNGQVNAGHLRQRTKTFWDLV